MSSTSCLLRADDGNIEGEGERHGEGYHIHLRFPRGDFFVVSFLCSQNEDTFAVPHRGKANRMIEGIVVPLDINDPVQ